MLLLCHPTNKPNYRSRKIKLLEKESKIKLTAKTASAARVRLVKTGCKYPTTRSTFFLEQNIENYDKHDVEDYILIVQKACLLL